MKQDFGPFELRKKIGSGGMASVYLGVQKSLDRSVVLKVLYPHLAEDEKLVARFEREARAAAMMRHENIVQVIDCGRYDDLSYIAMEFIEGQDLKKWLEANGAPPIEMALLMLRDILRGVEHAHSHRIVHRDIKPANIMLTPEGAIKIMDFGLARRGEESTTVTVVGTVMGTVAYMSPEQATGEAVDERADIFSSGVVGYELLGGRRPFEGDSYSAVLRAVLTVEPSPLESLNPLVPDSVVAVIHRMLHKDVSKRYPRIEQAREDLETVIEELGLHRSRDLLREYAKDPKEVSARLRKKHLSRHQDQATYYENLGRGKIQDAIREYRCVLYLDPDNKVASKRLEKLEQELSSPSHDAAMLDADSTLVIEPAPRPVPVTKAVSTTPSSPEPPAWSPPEPPAVGPSGADGPRAPSPAAPGAPALAPAASSSPAEGPDVPPGVLIASSPAPASVQPRPAVAPPPAAAAAASAPAKPSKTAKPAPVTAKDRATPAPAPVRLPKTLATPATPAQRLRTMLIAAAGLLALLVVIGVVVVSRGMLGRESTSVADTAPPAVPSTSGPASADLPSAPAPSTQTPPAERVPPAPAVTPGARASLVVETTPGEARVRIDGRVQSERSNATFGNLTPGTHTIIVEKEGYQDARRSVTFKPGEQKRLNLALVASPSAAATPTVAPPATESSGANGMLVVRATPYASYYVNDDLKATNLPTAQIPLKPGAYRVRIVHPEFGAHDWKDVRVEGGQRTTLAYDFLSTSTGSVRVTSQGIWASVIVDGQETGKTTPCVLELRLGPHTIELRRPGFSVEGGPRTVTVAGGSTMEVGFKMKNER